MSRKLQQVTRSTSATGGKIAAIDFAASGGRMKVHGAPNTGRDQRRSKRSTLAQPSLSTDSDGCTPDSTGDEDADGSQRDGAEADDEEGNDGDPDVQAPSDLNFDMGKGQAGHHQDQKSRPETEDEEGRQQAKSSSVSSNTVAPTSPVKDGINSDEDDYNDVDLISESGDEEPALEQLEEKAIIDSEEDNIGHPRPLSPPNSPAFPLYSVGFGNIDHELSPWLAEDPFFAEQINLLDPDGFACDTEYHGHDDSLDLVTGREDAPRRRVRFADPLMLPSETEQTESLKSDGATGPSTQFSVIKSLSDESRSTENNRNSIDGGAGSDVATLRPRTAQNDETPFEGFGSADNGDAESSVGSSSGYETDQGETTDEEDVPASATTRPSALLRQSSSELNNRLAGQPLPKAPTSRLPPGHRWGPTLGSWVADPTKPIAVVASSGKQLLIYPAQRPASRGGKVFPTIASSGQSSAQTSPRAAVPQLAALSYPTATEDSELERSEVSSQDAATPMLGASPNLMMSGFGLGSGNLLSGHAFGPPEAFFPFHSIGVDGKLALGDVNAGDDDDDDDDGEGLLNIEDFIDFGEDSEDSDNDDGSNTESFHSPNVGLSYQTGADATPTASPSTQSSPQNLFAHLDRGKVTAFRRNQHGYDANSYRPSSSSSFQIPNAIKTNAFVAASSFSPQKKRKLSNDFSPSVLNSPALAKRRMVAPY